MDTLVEARQLVKEYGAGLRVVDDVSFTIGRGETLGLVGESGSGKSTVARMLLRLVEPTSGEVRYDGRDVLAASAGELRAMRRRMQIVFQDPYAALNPRMCVREILAEPFAIHGERCPRERLAEMLGEVGLEASALERYPHEFSGGQRQRIQHCAGTGAAAGVRSAGRAGERTGCKRRGAGGESSARSAAKAWADVSVYLALDASGALPLRSCRGDAEGPTGGDGGVPRMFAANLREPYTRELIEATPEMRTV